MSYDLDAADVPAYFVVQKQAFGAAGATLSYRLRGPKGRKGIVRDILVDVSTACVGTTTVPEVQVGAAAGTTGAISVDYARFRLGSTAILGYDATATAGTGGAALRARALATQFDNTVTGTPKPVLADYAGHIALETALIPADAPFFITLLEGVGGTPAGAASVYVFVDWI